MKIHLVLEYQGEEGRVVDAYATHEAAVERCVRMGNARDQSNPNQITYHIIKKSVKGLGGINFQFQGKKRFITLARRK